MASKSSVIPSSNYLMKTAIGVSVAMLAYEIIVRPLAQRVVPARLT